MPMCRHNLPLLQAMKRGLFCHCMYDEMFVGPCFDFAEFCFILFLEYVFVETAHGKVGAFKTMGWLQTISECRAVTG